MPNFDELVLEETDEEGSDDLHACGWGRPLNTVWQPPVVLTVEVDVE